MFRMSSPRKGVDKDDHERSKSEKVRRREELEYKMFRMSSVQKKSDKDKDKKRKRLSSSSESTSSVEKETSNSTKSCAPEATPVTTFSRSFKVKKEVKKDDKLLVGDGEVKKENKVPVESEENKVEQV